MTKWTLSLVICLALAGCTQQPPPRVVDCRGNIEKPIAYCTIDLTGKMDCACITQAEADGK